MQPKKERQDKAVLQSFANPTEVRNFRGHGKLEVLNFPDGTVIGRGIFEPGWKWSNDVQPLAGTSSCESDHTGFCVSGRMVVRMNSGEEIRIEPGTAFRIPPGHDAWVEGNETCVLIDVTGFSEYARTGKNAAA